MVTDARRDPDVLVVGAHDPGDPLVVHPVLERDAVVELGGDRWRAVAPVVALLGVLDGLDLRRERYVSSGPLRPSWRGVGPRIERQSGDLDALAQPLHLEVVSVVGDELEAAHQIVLPAKYFAANRRISRSVVSLSLSASNSLTRAWSRASLTACDSGRLPGSAPGELPLTAPAGDPPQLSSCRCRTR